MFRRALALVGSLPQALLLKGAVIVLLCSTSWAAGNHHATVRALNEREQLGAETMAKNHEGIIAYFRDRMKEIRLEYGRQQRADAVAHEVYQQAIRSSAADLRDARTKMAALAKDNFGLRGTVDGLRNVNEVLASEVRPNPGCILPPIVRVTINSAIDSINNRPNAGPPQTASSELANGSHPDSQPITCSDLTASLIDVLEHDAMQTAWILSWQSWANELK